MSGNPSHRWIVSALALLASVIIVINLVLWSSYFRGKSETPSADQEAPSIIEESPTPTPTPATTEDNRSLINAVYAKTGLSPAEAEVTVTQNTGNHAKGNIKEYDAIGGAYWLAAKVDTEWLVVYDGQANPTCAQVDPYAFPNEMVPECMNEDGNVVNR